MSRNLVIKESHIIQGKSGLSEIREVGKGQIMRGLSDNPKEFEFFSESSGKILERDLSNEKTNVDCILK